MVLKRQCNEVGMPALKTIDLNDVPFLPPPLDEFEAEQALIQREKEHLDALKRRLDTEMRERDLHLKALHEKNMIKERDLEKLHLTLLDKEKELALAQADLRRVAILEQQLEDEKISFTHQKQELEKREKELRAKKAQLDEQEKNHVVAATHTLSQPVQVQPSVSVADDGALLEHRYAKKTDVKQTSKHVLRNHIHTIYHSLHNKNIVQAKEQYAKLKNEYEEFAQMYGQDVHMHQDILRAYHDIVKHIKHYHG
jgi:DNA repair exonuclease SbcCD ATPase subunit